MKKYNFKITLIIALFLSLTYFAVMSQGLVETLKYYPIGNVSSEIMSRNATQYSDSVQMWVADSAHIVYSATYNPGTGYFTNTYKNLELIQLYGKIFTKCMIDTTYQSQRSGLSVGTIRIWVNGEDSVAKSWSLIGDTIIHTEPGSLYVPDTTFGYIAIDKIGYIPFDIRVYAQCDSDSVGIVKVSGDSYLEGTYRLRQGSNK